MNTTNQLIQKSFKNSRQSDQMKTKLLDIFIDITDQRNELRRQFFFSKNISLNQSKKKLDLYDEIEQHYFEFLHLFFMNKKNERIIYDLLESIDKYERYLGLTILIDGFPSKELLSKLINKIIAFCIDGNDEELVLGRKLVRLKMLTYRNLLEFQVGSIICLLDKWLKSYDDFYYVYLNLGILVFMINTKPLVDSYLKWGEKHINNEDIREIYLNFLHKYKNNPQ